MRSRSSLIFSRDTKGLMIILFFISIVFLSATDSFSYEKKLDQVRIRGAEIPVKTKAINPVEYEFRCKEALVSLGAAQLSYAGMNRYRDYGTWQSLVKANLIQQGLSRANFIEKYSISTFDVRLSSKRPDGTSAFNSTFTIVAFPRTIRIKGYSMHVYGIGNDQILRKWDKPAQSIFAYPVSLKDESLWDVVNWGHKPLESD